MERTNQILKPQGVQNSRAAVVWRRMMATVLRMRHCIVDCMDRGALTTTRLEVKRSRVGNALTILTARKTKTESTDTVSGRADGVIHFFSYFTVRVFLWELQISNFKFKPGIFHFRDVLYWRRNIPRYYMNRKLNEAKMYRG